MRGRRREVAVARSDFSLFVGVSEAFVPLFPVFVAHGLVARARGSSRIAAKDCVGWSRIQPRDKGESSMRVAKENVEVKMEIPGAVIRQETDFGDATGLGRSAARDSRCRRVSTRRRCSRVWKAICANARTGASSYAAESPRPTRMALERLSMRTISSTGHPDTTSRSTQMRRSSCSAPSTSTAMSSIT